MHESEQKVMAGGEVVNADALAKMGNGCGVRLQMIDEHPSNFLSVLLDDKAGNAQPKLRVI